MALKLPDLVGIHLRERLSELLDEALTAEARSLSPRQEPADRFGAVSRRDDITLQGPGMPSTAATRWRASRRSAP